MPAIQPDMSVKIINESHFKFIVECRAKIIKAVHEFKKGKDFLLALSDLKFSTNKEWTKNSSNDPLVTAMLETLEEYKKVEKRPNRLKIVVPILEYGIGLMNDLFWRERITWMIWIFVHKLRPTDFPVVFLDPDNWYPVGRGTTPEYKEYEAKDIPIEEEYRVWYGIDPLNPENIPEEIKKKNIEEGIAWMLANNPAAYGRYTGDWGPYQEWVKRMAGERPA